MHILWCFLVLNESPFLYQVYNNFFSSYRTRTIAIMFLRVGTELKGFLDQLRTIKLEQN